MAVGDILFFTVGYTDSGPGITRENYPIKKKYRQSVDTQTPVWPSSYELTSDTKTYWMPYQGTNVGDFNYIEYTPGDEYAWSDDDAVRPPQLPSSRPNTQKYDDYPINHRIIYANEIYVATRFTFEWELTGFDGKNNPYKFPTVRKWKKQSDTSSSWVQYWYHPLLRRFYVIADTDDLQELPDFTETSQTRWDNFIGDSKDMNLRNFTLAQIRELISRGVPEQTAVAEVGEIESRALTGQTASSSPQSAPPTVGSGSFTISRQSIGSTGESGSAGDNFPKMLQRSPSGFSLSENEYIYTFHMRPNNISYSNIGVTWTEIDRVNNYALVDYKNKKLMRISFEFVVEAHSGQISSIYESCEDRLRRLQTMANRPEHIVFINFDSLFGGEVPTDVSKKYRAWVIAEMSINSVQRTPSSSVGDIAGSISRATVNMTIQEVQQTPDQIIFMPKLRKVPQTPTKKCTENCGDTDLCIRYFTDDTPSAKTPPSACAKRTSLTRRTGAGLVTIK